MLERSHPQIFLSYAWANAEMANSIDHEFQKYGIELTRDIRDVQFSKSIKDFMNSISTSDYIIMLISDEYIKSDSCMYEVSELFNSIEFGKKLLPIVIDNADIFNNKGRNGYYEFWLQKLENKREVLSTHLSEATLQEFKITENIVKALDEFLTLLINIFSIRYEDVNRNGFKQIFTEIGFDENYIWHAETNKISSLRIISATINGQKIPISPFEEKSANYFTIVIGNNATGKSRLLVNILNNLRKKNNPRLRKLDEKVVVELNLNSQQINSFEAYDSIEYFRDEINLISISNSLFDKFDHPSKSEKNYTYIGSRMEGMTHKRAIINDLMDIFSENLNDPIFVTKAKELFNFLKIRPVLKIGLKPSFGSRNNFQDVLQNNSTPEDLRKYIIKVSDQGFFRQQSKKLLKYSENISLITGLHLYIKKYFEGFSGGESKLRRQSYEINLDDDLSNDAFSDEYQYFSFMRRLNLITYDYIRLIKEKNEYDILDSSTGEIGLLTTFLRALPEMRSNSIIFIDEPELSLHPSWQMKYIELLRKFLHGYSNCHVLIATHSHFILSDLQTEWSSILVLKKDSKDRHSAELIEYSTYGWSPETILYDVFGVANVRNHYFEMDVKKLLHLISNDPENLIEIKKRINSLRRFKMNDDDPINILLVEAEKLIQ